MLIASQIGSQGMVIQSPLTGHFHTLGLRQLLFLRKHTAHNAHSRFECFASSFTTLPGTCACDESTWAGATMWVFPRQLAPRHPSGRDGANWRREYPHLQRAEAPALAAWDGGIGKQRPLLLMASHKANLRMTCERLFADISAGTCVLCHWRTTADTVLGCWILTLKTNVFCTFAKRKKERNTLRLFTHTVSKASDCI